MFDISFSELIVIAVVALVVIGPEKLPKVARTIGLLVGRVQRFASQVKDEVNREARFEDLQRLQGEVQQSILSVEDRASKLVADIQTPEVVPQSKPAKKLAGARTKADNGSKADTSPKADTRPKSEVGSKSSIVVKPAAKTQSSAQTKSRKTKQSAPVATKRASKDSRSV